MKTIIITMLVLAAATGAVKSQNGFFEKSVKSIYAPNFNKDSTKFWWCDRCDTLFANTGFKIIVRGPVAMLQEKEPQKKATNYVEFLPDTIPVYFKELVIGKVTMYDLTDPDAALKDRAKRDTPYIIEQWQKGFVIWQTYRKYPISTYIIPSASAITQSVYYKPEYYKEEFEPNDCRTEKYLYEDMRPVTNKVLLVLKR